MINPPIGIAAAVVAYRVVAERRRAPDAKFDLAGAVTLTVGQLVLVYGVVEAGLAGWSSPKALDPDRRGDRAADRVRPRRVADRRRRR